MNNLIPASITVRAQVEEQFHDAWARSLRLEELLVYESFQSPTAVENHHALQALGGMAALRGKRLLDLGCGSGEAAVFFALHGAEVTAADVSGEMLRVADALAAHHGVSVRTTKTVAEDMPFADEEFDYVYGNGLLHHVELEPAIQEIRRVLKIGGRAAFIEPLAHNPLIHVYRHMARAVRTPTERPFHVRHFEIVKRHFSSCEHREFWLLSLAIFVYYYLIERIDPGVDRYWRRIIRDGWRVQCAFRRLQGLDRALLRLIPGLRRWCWNTVIVVQK